MFMPIKYVNLPIGARRPSSIGNPIDIHRRKPFLVQDNMVLDDFDTTVD